METLFGGILYVIAVYIAHPVFMTPIQAEPVAPLSSTDILANLDPRNLLGYAPNVSPYNEIMKEALALLKINESLQAATEEDLNNMLYQKFQGKLLKIPVIWVIWKPKMENVWMFHIRSTEHAKYEGQNYITHDRSLHLSTGFLAVQLAVSQAILKHVSPVTPKFSLDLVSMPLSPLMEAHRVKTTLSGILLCFTLAMLPPVLDTQALVVAETRNKLKHAFRLREIGYPSIYIGWLTYASLTALPLCLLGGITLIQIFRWIHVMEGILIMMAYVSLMMMFALMMAMFHSTPWIACTWSFLFTLIETYLAELLVHHEIDVSHFPVIFFLHWVLPPLGLIDSLHQFSLLQTGKGKMTTLTENIMIHTMRYTFLSWCFMMLIYSAILMLLQRTIGQERAIGGQVSWKSIIFKKAEDHDKLHPILHPSIKDREKLQEVDGLVAKAVSFRNVSKNIMGTQVLHNINFDIYRGEYTLLCTEPIQKRMLYTLENLLTGLTQPDSGTISILGKDLQYGSHLMCTPQMLGFCHRNATLMDDITVKEHLIMFLEICLWNETRQNILEYSQIRIKKLLHDCDLNVVRHERVKNLGPYYRAQLCWAIAMIVEPRILVIPEFKDNTTYRAVLTDKILQYRKYITIVKMSFSSVELEYADRVFWFDHKNLVFGGTPAYMYFKYGREYRLRLSLRSNSSMEDGRLSELLKKVTECGATVRAHLGLLLILRLPTTPTATVAAFVKDVMENATKYGVASLNISLPDTEELARRAVNESRKATIQEPETCQESQEALKEFAEQMQWTRKKTFLINIDQFNVIFWKYFMFYWNNKIVLTVTLISAVVTGTCVGLTMAYVLADIYHQPHFTKAPAIHRSRSTAFTQQVLTVESLEQTTTLVVRLDDSVAARSVAHGYVLSHTNATEAQVKNMYYIAIARPGSMTEYLVTRAIDSPQLYVYMYAYGLGVSTDSQGQLVVHVLYSALHHDKGAAARSLARTYMALIRHYTGLLDASIEITDDPLSLDLSPWLRDVSAPPLFIQLLFILTIVHINLVPSHEHGLVRHFQSNAYDFSPAMYWLTLYACDIIFYWFLVVIMTVSMVSMMLLILPLSLTYYLDLMVVPFMLLIYGIGCIPQAYLFSLGPRRIMNTVTYAIVNIAFGETSIIAKIFYGNALDVAMNFMSLSPQFNMAYSYVKIGQIFLYNYECIVFRIHNICLKNTLHKCCETCGVLQECFTQKSYFTPPAGVLMELIAIIVTAFLFFILLLLVEYRLFKCLWLYVTAKYEHKEKEHEIVSAGIERERADVLEKRAQLHDKPQIKLDTFGEYILVKNVSMKRRGFYAVHNVYLGLAKGEVLAISGLPGHGRVQLTKILAGLEIPSDGNVWAMSKWRLEAQPYKYSQQVSFCCGRNSLPSWMSVYEALKMIATLRGVPQLHIQHEIWTLLVALDLQSQAEKLVRDVVQADRTRLNFVATVIGAPPILILDEPTAYQKFTVRRAMYHILYQLKKRGHAIFIGSSNVESHMPVTNRLGLIVDGEIYDLDTVDNLLERYSTKGYTVVVHLKDEVNVSEMFGKYFKNFVINDSSEVLVNVQIRDPELNWTRIFEKMENLQKDNEQIYSYIITATPLDYIYNNIICKESGHKQATRLFVCFRIKNYFFRAKPKIYPPLGAIHELRRFERRFSVTKLTELPWSVIFHT